MSPHSTARDAIAWIMDAASGLVVRVCTTLRWLTPFALLILAGCRAGVRPGSSEELVLWSSPSGVEEQAFLRICRRFENEHPGVVVHNLGGVTMEKLQRAIVSSAPPDLAYLYNTTAIGPLAANRAVRPLDADFARSGFRESDFLPLAIAQGRYAGQLYAMPMTRDSRAFYWNRARFRQAGIDPNKPPVTLEDTLELAARLTLRNPDGSIKLLGMQMPDDAALLFAMFGGGVWDARARRLTTDRPENVAALRWLVALADAQGGYPMVSAFAAGFGSEQSSQNALASGKVAMRIDGEWLPMYFDKYAPGTDFGLGELPYPELRPDLKNTAWSDGDILLIPIGAKHPALAWEFIRWMHQPSQQREYAAAMHNLPSLLSLCNAPEFATGSRSRRALGYVLRHIASHARNARIFPALPVMQLYENALNDAFQRALLHEKTPEQALADVQTRITREMRGYPLP